MSTFSVTGAATAGPRLLMARPLAAVVWALVYVGFLFLIATPFAGPLVAAISTLARSGSNPTIETLAALFADLFGFLVLWTLGAMVLGAVIACAIYRSILQPEKSAFAYLRLGGEELWVLLVTFVRGILVFILQFALSVPLGIIVVLVGMGNHAAVALVTNLGQIVIAFAAIWVNLRLSLAGPMTFSERQFRLFESWTLTRGSDWRLVGVVVLVGVMASVFCLFVAVIGIATGTAIWNMAPHPTDVQAALRQPPSEWMRELTPFLTLIGILLWGALTVLVPLATAPFAFIYQRLHPSADRAATFA